MITKEEILKNKGEAWEYSNRLEVTPVADAYWAMEQYAEIKAKEKAIEFKEWCENGNEYLFDNNEQRAHTTEELYNIFIEQSKQKK